MKPKYPKEKLPDNCNCWIYDRKENKVFPGLFVVGEFWQDNRIVDDVVSDSWEVMHDPNIARFIISVGLLAIFGLIVLSKLTH